jgi:hypothetical protein
VSQGYLFQFFCNPRLALRADGGITPLKPNADSAMGLAQMI